MQSTEDKQVAHKLKCITVISLMFMTVQIVGGIMANSVAILADAFHLLSDVIAYMISLQAVLMSHKKAPFYLTFGYQKLQPLGALVNVAIIWFVTIQLVIEATQRIFNKSIVEEPLYMLLTSFFGLGCNLYIMRVLHSGPHGHDGHDHGHDHGHGHSHGHSHGHDHGHSHSHEKGHSCSKDHNHEQKEKVEKPKCSHSHGDNHNHDHNEHNHDHGHDHHDHDHHDHDHDHDNSQKKSEEQKCEVEHDHDLDSQNCSNKGYLALSKQSLNEEIGNNYSTSQDLIKGECSHGKGGSFFNNINIQAAYIHIISDIILSIGVIISALIIYFCTKPEEGWTYWQLADPFCTYLFSIMAIYSTIGIIKDSSIILLDGCDDKSMLKDVVAQLDTIKDIENYSELRVWSMNRNKFSAAVKITLDHSKFNDMDRRDAIKSKVTKVFSRREIISYVEVEQFSHHHESKQ